VIRLGRVEKLWVAGGVLGAAALVAIGYFLFISPQYGQADQLVKDRAAAAGRLAVLQQRLAELNKQNEKLAQYQAEVARNRKALPTEPGLSDLLRELQTAGDTTGVQVSGLTVGGATAISAAGAQLYALPLTLTATGTVDRLHEFLNQLQQVQPRALLISGANLTASDQGGASLTLTLRAFMAKPAPSASPSPSASASASASPSASPSPSVSRSR
jgi:Tfp pilus assembly protein PilO